MNRLGIVTVVAAVLSVICGGGCTDRTSALQAKAQPAASTTPTPTALWAYRQVDTLLIGGPDTLAALSEQLRAIATIEGDDPDAALPMDLRSDEMETIWARVREKYDTEWVRGYMVDDKRAMFIHTLISLHIRSKSPALLEGMPGPFGADADRWPAWIEEHKAQLDMK